MLARRHVVLLLWTEVGRNMQSFMARLQLERCQGATLANGLPMHDLDLSSRRGYQDTRSDESAVTHGER